ncbi:MAG: HAD family hydrolase [Brevibacterium aurantiacum]|uniref:HAD family phosphatase n=1 Tax=Brevibacterium aurantiacum TaxID=273384 RepID=A0A2A3X5F5_BREAU|nr:HAD family phosphatase [Brevibacterium aurantiacum]MDN5593895.1 HAD family phosphatase [Brevibacterium sp.]AZL04844.1 HAD family phosphatase [Brevibacterium aurantiacum]AZL12042.1 HAD family phosphatase [Brevibacterium aurantiacum]AZT92412.1 HAD family phosphatase [Brevibacterium aurantiacum]AZT96262.1 HAD family phosphatase [Brevibacterium aurantiacum]
MIVSDLEGAIFDCDGILVDSEQPWIDLMTSYLRNIGASHIPAEQLRGLTAAEAVTSLVEIHRSLGSPADAAPPAAAEVDAAYSDALADLSAPMPGAREFVASMSGAIPVAVASNGRAEDVRGLLERAGMLHLFDVIVTIDDVEHGKPDPAPYLLAAQRLGLAASAVAAFEDSPVGSQAAADAGCTVVGINDDPDVELAGQVRLTDFGQLHFDRAARSLHLLR